MAAALLLVGACTSGSGESGETEREVDPPETTVPAGSAASSPFSVDLPEGYELVNAGVGQMRQGWGEDCCGSDEPYTILERTDVAGGPVRVSIAGYEDTEGGFVQTVNGYGHDDLRGERADIDGKVGVWSEGDPDGTPQSMWSWPELAVDEGDDVAVSVSGPGLTRGEAEAIYPGVVVGGPHDQPPSVPSPPDGYAVVGAVDADGVIALRWGSEPHPDSVVGTAAEHSAGWTQGSRSLAVLTAPGRSTSLEAAALSGTEATGTSEVRSVDGEPVLVTDSGPGWDWRSITVALHAPWGDLVVVNAFTDQARSQDPVELPSIDELVALARSVQQATQPQWDAFVASVPS